MHNILRHGILAVVLCGTTATWAGNGLGLRNPNGHDGMESWPRWQGRLSLGGASGTGLRAGLGQGAGDPFELKGSALSRMSLMGDYYFRSVSFGQSLSGGLRATSGIVMGPRSSLLSATALPSLPGSSRFSLARMAGGMAHHAAGDGSLEISTVPYVGVGYSGFSLKGGLSFSADLGLTAMNPGPGMHLDRVLSGGQGLDDLVRDLQLRPVIQVGVSYSF